MVRDMNEAAVKAPRTSGAVRAHLGRFDDVINRIDHAALVNVIERLRRARDLGHSVFIAGNGGSAATASHFANDLGKAAKHASLLPFRAMSLADNTSWLTALANDEGYERVFSGQLENFASGGDVLIVISASGNSSNLIEAVRLAVERDLETIGFLGFNGGALLQLVDQAVLIETNPGEYGIVETAHSLLCDVVTTCLVADRDAQPES